MIINLKTACGYGRTSSTTNPKESIPNQKKLIKDYCEREGIILKEIYVDEALTGIFTQNRFNYQSLKK